MHAFDRQTDRQTDRRTDRQTEISSLRPRCIPCSAVKMGNPTPCKIVTSKILNWNFACVITSGRLPTTQILVLIGTVGVSPHTGDILQLCDFFGLSCPVLFSRESMQAEPLNRFSRFMAQTMWFCIRKCLLGVRTMGDVIWGNMPSKPSKNGRK